MIASNEGTKKRRVMDYLASGKTLTAAQAKSRFNVGNMRACISDIKNTAEQYGNWEIFSVPTATTTSAYGMDFVGDNPNNPFLARVS
tara:strand:+ start:429 stop:689 length:261 start_codon:yes stop_codon:yes gene_type:complete